MKPNTSGCEGNKLGIYKTEHIAETQQARLATCISHQPE